MDFTARVILMDHESGRHRPRSSSRTGWSRPTADGAIRFVNRRAEQILGIAPATSSSAATSARRCPCRTATALSWWEVTDPWGGLRIRTGHREKLLMLPTAARELLVTAKYLRPGRNQPVTGSS